jgi:hypothetical protein
MEERKGDGSDSEYSSKSDNESGDESGNEGLPQKRGRYDKQFDVLSDETIQTNIDLMQTYFEIKYDNVVKKMGDQKLIQMEELVAKELLISFITIVLGLIDSLHDFYKIKKIDDNEKNAIRFYLLIYLKHEINKWVWSNYGNISEKFYNEVNSICLYIENSHIGLYDWTINILNLKNIKSPFLSFPNQSQCKNTFQITFTAFLERNNEIRMNSMSNIVNNIKFNGIVEIFKHFDVLKSSYYDFRLYDNILLYRNLIYNIIKNIKNYIKVDKTEQIRLLELIKRLLTYLDTLFNTKISALTIDILEKFSSNPFHPFIKLINLLDPSTYPSLYIYDQGIEHIYLTGHKLYIDKKTDEGTKQTFKSVNDTSYERVLKFTEQIMRGPNKHNIYGIEYNNTDECLFSNYKFIPASGAASGAASVAASTVVLSSDKPQQLLCYLDDKKGPAVNINSISAITNELLQLNESIKISLDTSKIFDTIGCLFGAKRTGDWLQCIQAKKYNILISTGDFWCQMYALLTQTPIIIDDILYNYIPDSELNIDKWVHFFGSNLKISKRKKLLNDTDKINVDMFKNMLLKDIIRNYGPYYVLPFLVPGIDGASAGTPSEDRVSAGTPSEDRVSAGTPSGTPSGDEDRDASGTVLPGKPVPGLNRSQTQTIFSHNALNIQVGDLKYILKKYLKYKNKYLKKKTGRIIDNHEMDAITNNLFENVNESNIKQNIEKINNKYLKYKNKYLKINI